MRRNSVANTLIAFSLLFTGIGCSYADDTPNLLANADFERIDPANSTTLPANWSVYQWGTEGSRFQTVREVGTGRNGSAGVRAQNIDDVAQAGIYTNIDLEPGTYQLSAWVRAEKGKKSRVRIYLGLVYSRVFTIDDTWQQVQFTMTFLKPVKRGEINVQNASGEAGSVWFDDLRLQAVEGVTYERVADNRPQHPRTLLFSPININYLKDSAKEWADRGFRGFMFDKIMADWPKDIWATDGDPKTRGADDKLLQELLQANKAASKVGIDSNFVKVAIYTKWPTPYDDDGWKKLTDNLAQAARFAKMGECAGVAIDTEYTSEQFEPKWIGYAANPRPLPELKAKIRERWHTVVSGMLKEFPDMVLLTLPEGTRVYGELYNDLFNGMLAAMAEADAPGGIHVFTEQTYDTTDAASLSIFERDLEETIFDATPEELRAYWKKRGTIALGAWPLGYYRQVIGPDGKALGYSGRQEVFGDKIVGSYADKSARYSPEKFAEQMAGLNTFSPRYNWIYGHGDVFTQLTPEQKARYAKMTHESLFNVEIPTAPNLDEYYKSIKKPEILVVKK